MGEMADLHRQIVHQKRELQHKNDELEQASTRVTEVLESLSDAFYALDPQWRIVLVNGAQALEAELSREAMLGRVFWELFPTSADPHSEKWEAFHRCMAERVEVQFVTHDVPHDRWLSLRVSPTAAGGVAVFTRDVSIERRAQAVLKLQTDFEQQLIGIVSHDLRSPLTVISLGTSLLLHQRVLDEPSARIVTRIQSSAASATRMIRDLLDFTKARLGGGIPIDPLRMNLAEVASRALNELRAAYPGREIRLEHQAEVEGEWDSDRIAQVVSNLVSNALKYSPETSPVQITCRAEAGWATLSVKNQGAAIPPEKLEQIFEPLQRATVGGTDRSVGLGLYIVRKIADAHGGSIEVESTEAGTTFTLRLPLSG